MPYEIVKRGEKWLVRNKEAGHVKGTHDSETKAQHQINLLRGVEHGWHPTGAKAKK